MRYAVITIRVPLDVEEPDARYRVVTDIDCISDGPNGAGAVPILQVLESALYSYYAAVDDPALNDEAGRHHAGLAAQLYCAVNAHNHNAIRIENK